MWHNSCEHRPMPDVTTHGGDSIAFSVEPHNNGGSPTRTTCVARPEASRRTQTSAKTSFDRVVFLRGTCADTTIDTTYTRLI